MSLSDFTESVSSGNKGFLGGLGEKLRKNFNYYLGSDNDEEDKKSERAEIDTRESNTISSVVEAEDLRQVQQQIPKIHDEKDQNQQKPEENEESKFLDASEAMKQMEEIITQATREVMQQYMKNTAPVEMAGSEYFKNIAKETTEKSATKSFCDARVRHRNEEMTNAPIVIEDLDKNEEKIAEKKEVNEPLEQSFLNMMLDQNRKQQEMMIKLIENTNYNKKDDDNKANSKVVQEHILSKPPTAYRPTCAEQSIVILLVKNFEKYLRNRMLNTAEMKIALMTIFRDSASAEEKVRKIVDDFEGDLKKTGMRKALYKLIIKKLKGVDENDENYEKYDEQETLFDYFLRLKETVLHNQPELTTKKLNRKTLTIMLNVNNRLLDEENRRYIKVEKERLEHVFDFSDIDDIEKFFVQMQKLKRIVDVENINLVSDVLSVSRENFIENDSQKIEEINYISQNNFKQRECYACGENHLFINCRNEVKVKEYWSKYGNRFNENFSAIRENRNYQDVQPSSSENFETNREIQPEVNLMSTPNTAKTVSVMKAEITNEIFNTGSTIVREAACNFLKEKVEVGEANDGKYLLLNLKINGINIKTATDRGCTASGVISEQLVRNLGLWNFVETDNVINLKTAKGLIKQINTTLTQQILIGGKYFEETFIVCPDLNVHCLIGKPLLKKIGLLEKLNEAIEDSYEMNRERLTKRD